MEGVLVIASDPKGGGTLNSRQGKKVWVNKSSLILPVSDRPARGVTTSLGRKAHGLPSPISRRRASEDLAVFGVRVNGHIPVRVLQGVPRVSRFRTRKGFTAARGQVIHELLVS